MKASFVSSVFFLLVVTSCNKIEKTDSPVDFPAAYVVNGATNSISIINMETDELVQTCTFKKGTWPHHIYTNTAQDKLVVSLVGIDISGGHAGHGSMAAESYIMILDATNLKVLDCKKTETTSHNALFMNADSEIWMAEMTDNGVVKCLDSKTLKEKKSIAVGMGPLEITTDANGVYGFVANGAGNTVSVIDVATASVVKTIAVGDEPVGAWPASNNKMYVDCEGSKEVYEIDVTTLVVTDTIDLGYMPAYVSFNSNSSELWVSDTENGGVHTYTLTGGSWVEASFIATGANAHAIAFNSDYSKAYITNQGANNVSVINTSNNSKVKDIPVGNKPNGICIIP